MSSVGLVKFHFVGSVTIYKISSLSLSLAEDCQQQTTFPDIVSGGRTLILIKSKGGRMWGCVGYVSPT